MTLPTPLDGPLGEECVALDLETTGLDQDRDSIIEIGAVRFRGAEVLGTFQTLVNPYQPLSPFIRRLTGITQRDVDEAPPFAAVTAELAEFVGSAAVVGHNVAFDIGFLGQQGVTFSGQSYDTWDLATTVLPSCTEYSLPRLAKYLGLVHPRPHRALPDAQTTHAVLMALMERVRELDPGVAAFIQ